MSKPLARLGVGIDEDTWKILRRVEEESDIRPFTFLIEGGDPRVWLCYVADSEDVFTRIHDYTTKRGCLQMKSAGESKDWWEASLACFRAATRVERAERALAAAGGVGAEVSTTEEHAAAVMERDQAREAFEVALIADARQAIDHEEFERENERRLRE
jgi:hypothetical protein